MRGYAHLTADERDRIAGLKADGASLRGIARALGRAASTISRELRRNALDSGVWRPHVADGAYMLRRQRAAVLETDAELADYVTARLSEGWTPEQIAGRLRLGIETGLRAVCAEAIYGWVYRPGQKAERLWRLLTRGRARRRKRHGRASKDIIAEKTHISQRSCDADARETVGHWEADLVICKRSRPVLVLHERKTRITLMSRLAGKTAAETVAAMMATFRRLDPRMRGSATFDNDTCFARHTLLRGMLSATTYFCDAYASWQKGGIENANGRIRRWLPRGTDLDALDEADIQEIAMTINLTPRKCLGYRSPVEAFLSELGRNLEIRFA
ncbi:IS30 family transposase [Amaricoccus sp.]|uniref:IS30 family transposase n=1 Tax=Amaricoccus sp. TaxID=1872485 RepID=UPI001B57D8FC|nr:IS30 family transposase [Amaricoccus sp.]MBP7242147.1 IS30 family transposase [Amaricoccus sp.]